MSESVRDTGRDSSLVAAQAQPGGAAPESKPTFETAGENLVGRALAKELRIGVEHYVPGQHQATLERGMVEYDTDRPVEVGRITFVDVAGHACVVLTLRYLDDYTTWFPTWVGRAGQNWQEDAVRAPAGFTLSEKMLEALRVAERTPEPGTGDSQKVAS